MAQIMAQFYVDRLNAWGTLDACMSRLNNMLYLYFSTPGDDVIYKAFHAAIDDAHAAAERIMSVIPGSSCTVFYDQREDRYKYDFHKVKVV